MEDKAVITVKAGDGGAGIASLIHESYRPKGGPDGGNGGRGGDVYIEASDKINSLSLFNRKKSFVAQSGMSGEKNYRSGKKGDDLVIKVPVGTVVKQVKKDSEELIADLSKLGEKKLIAKGGKGGLGNAFFKSSTNITPKTATPGHKGEKIKISLELKLLSNVGLVGFPSVGKSTLINSLAKSNYKVGSYHFTTLKPNLGVVDLGEGKSLVISDLPGIIEGASEGKGLGEQFLRHIERCGVVIFMLDPTQTKSFLQGNFTKDAILNDLKNDYTILTKELSSWSKKLVNKPSIILINKVDITEIGSIVESLVLSIAKFTNKKVIPISAASFIGLNELKNYLKENYQKIVKVSSKQLHKQKKGSNKVVIDLSNIPNKRILFKS